MPSNSVDMSIDSQDFQAICTSDVGAEVGLPSQENPNNCLSQAYASVVKGICHH